MGIGAPSIEVDDEPGNGLDCLNPTWEVVRARILSGEMSSVLDVEGFISNLNIKVYWEDIEEIIMNGINLPIGEFLISRMEDLDKDIVLQIAQKGELVSCAIQALFCWSQNSGGLLWEDIDPLFLKAGLVSPRVFRDLKDEVSWEMISSFINSKQISVKTKTSIISVLKAEEIDKMLESIVSKEVMDLWESRVDITEEEREKNRELVNRYQEAFTLEKYPDPEDQLSGIDPSTYYFRKCEERKGKRTLNFYIRSINIKSDYQLVCELLFHITNRYRGKSRIFSEFHILPRATSDKFASFIPSESIMMQKGHAFRENAICHANTIHFSHGESIEGSEGARPLICDKIVGSNRSSDEYYQKEGKNQNNGSFSRLSFENELNDWSIESINEILTLFLQDLQRFEEEIIAEAKEYLEKHQKEIEEVGDSQ